MASDTTSAKLTAFSAAHASLLTRLHEQAGAARWEVSHEEFAEAIYRSAVYRFGLPLPEGETLTQYLGGLHLADLALTCALRRGAEPAWEEFVASYRPLLYAAARAIVRAGEARARELADSLYAELYGLNRGGAGSAKAPQRAGRKPLLDYFHGRSKLSTWLRAALAQRHVDSLRAGQRVDSFDGEAPQAAPAAAPRAAAVGDPDRTRLLPRLRQAVAAAFAAASPADRLLLSLYYVQEMTLAQIARVQGVHEATISRQLERIRRELRSRVELSLTVERAAGNGFAALPALSPAEIELCFRYALEDWSFDLGGTLSGAGAERGGV